MSLETQRSGTRMHRTAAYIDNEWEAWKWLFLFVQSNSAAEWDSAVQSPILKESNNKECDGQITESSQYSFSHTMEGSAAMKLNDK